MDPSKEKNQAQTPPAKRKSKIIPIIFIVLLLTATCGAALYFYTSSQKSTEGLPGKETPVSQEQLLPKDFTVKNDLIDGDLPIGFNKEPVIDIDDGIETTDIKTDTPFTAANDKNPDKITSEQTEDSSEIKQEPLNNEEPVKVSICNEPVKQLDTFYTHLDKQAYMSSYKTSEPAKIHFSRLIIKLLANPPQVTRESDDLYTILKNTAHFFRISGKDNILMLKGILDNEKASLEQILSDYYLLVSTPECSTSSYGEVNKDALYEYACFFLNTMGGRLYLFRRDSLSRMVVTYYAILLVDEANIQNNNRHGIALRPVVDMLVSEMEMSGSSLKKSEIYLDKLYDLKEKYQ